MGVDGEDCVEVLVVECVELRLDFEWDLDLDLVEVKRRIVNEVWKEWVVLSARSLASFLLSAYSPFSFLSFTHCLEWYGAPNIQIVLLTLR